MNITINIVEVATELADQYVIKEFGGNEYDMYKKVSEDETKYTDKAQEVFNVWYDYYYDFLMIFNI